MIKAATMSEVWHDVYDGALSRRGDEAFARDLADRVEGLIRLGFKYQKGSWLRSIGAHWSSWWAMYTGVAFVSCAIALPLTFVSTTPHWAGLSKNDAAWYAERHALSWYRSHYPANGAKQFDTGLYLALVSKTRRGPIQFWNARFQTEKLGNLCVLFNSNVYYVKRCQPRKATR